MEARTPPSSGERLLIFTPIGKDSELVARLLLQDGVECKTCGSVEELLRECQAGAAAALIAEEGMVDSGIDRFDAWCRAQPAWSDLPLLVLTRPGADSDDVRQIVARLGNVTLLERPARFATLLSATRAALRARKRQYQVRDQLEALRNSAAELERSRAELLAADRRKDEFIATLAHELRNPLAPIRNGIATLSLSEEGHGSSLVVSMMSRQLSNVVRIVDDLLDISRITRGRIVLHEEIHELGAILQQAAETAFSALEARGHRLEIEGDTRGLRVQGDSVRLVQVFSNLLDNAAKYSPEPGTIRVTITRDGEFVAVAVRDRGIGIDAEALPRVFDMFMQVRDAEHRAQGGLGIGLTLVRNLVEMHGGTVHATSEGVGEGTEFTVRLPLTDLPLRAADDPGPGAPLVAARPARVLVVDDNADAATSLGELLKLLGVEVEVAYGGEDALAKVAAFLPNLAFVDIGMPGMDGYEVAQRLRAMPSARGLVLVALTGWGQVSDRQRSARAGFDHHLVKPAGFEDIRRLLES
ncbi:MAG TPA: ATP-binding protein, partial [Nevskiaceae bacterium]|nr:ATP-binding protein [Nevskiaceae bacterium]